MENDIVKSLDSSGFDFVGTDEKEVALKTKPVGFYQDVFKRFIKKKTSIVALSIIVLLLIFSFVLPLFYSFDSGFLEPDFRFARPKNIFSSGKYERNLSMTEYYSLAGVGVAEKDRDGDGSKNIKDGENSSFQPIVSYSIGEQNAITGTRRVIAKIDSYLEPGFLYKNIQLQEWDKIKEFEKDTGRHVIFPMVDRNSAFYVGGAFTERPPEYTSNANYWFEITNNQLNPQWDNGQVGKFVDNYLRFSPDDLTTTQMNEYQTVHQSLYGRSPSENEVLQYAINSGTGGNSLTIRVLAYDYFVYKNGVEPSFWLGTNDQGYDIFARLTTAFKTSIYLALLVSLISIIIGIVIGSICGFYGGKTDLFVNRLQDIMVGLPIIVVVTLIYLNFVVTESIPIFVGLIISFVLYSWVAPARIVRTQFFRFKNQEYVLASKTLGAKNRRLMFKHIFPNSLGTLITQFSLAIPAVILTEVVLYFLGILQVGSGGATLGILINEGSKTLTNAPYIIFFPVLVFALIMFSFNLLGNSLRDSFDPSQRGK